MALIDRFQRWAPTQKMYDLYVVAETVKAPMAGFEGIRTIDHESLGDRHTIVEEPDPSGLCVAAVPLFRITPEGKRVEPPEGTTFAVFMDRRLTIFDWDWIRVDPADLVSPIGWQDRFTRKIWPKN